MTDRMRPNIVYFHSHDTGRYIQPYGFGCDSPSFQRLAEGGLLFRNAFCAAPTCSPSRAALVTGQSPHTAGMLGLVQRGFRLNDPSQHLATVLREAGYLTTLAGLQHVTVDDPATLGFDDRPETAQTDATIISDRAVEAIRGYGTGSRTQPFFLDVGFFDTHRPFPDTTDEDARYVRPPLPIPDTPETRRDMAGFQARLSVLDRSLGRVLDALDAANLASSTIVIATTDHGVPFPMMKCNLTDHGTGVLLIMRGPGVIPSGMVTDALVSQIDVFPTICDLVGMAHPAWLQGRSLLPILDDANAEVNQDIFAEVTYHGAYEPQRAIRTDRWTYIERFTDRKRPVLPNCDLGISRDYYLAHNWADAVVDQIQLYDNLFDPVQTCNLASAPEYAGLRVDLHARLHTWMAETSDPLQFGDVLLPAGAMMNDVDSASFRTELIVADGNDTYRRVPFPGPLQ